MSTIDLHSFCVLGISVRTTNENGQSAVDIPQLWNRFFSENIPGKITERLDRHLYCVYSDYEKDHSRPYTTTIGFCVSDETTERSGLTKTYIQSGRYRIFSGSGITMEGFVYAIWEDIWNKSFHRKYGSDFEKYTINENNPDFAEVQVFVGTDSYRRMQESTEHFL